MTDNSESNGIDIGFKYYLFGSGNSNDIDVLIDHPDALGEIDDRLIALELKKQYPEIDRWDINIIKIENGIVRRSIPFKGSPDQVHNSLFYTYELHDQQFEKPINSPVERNFAVAIAKTMKGIFTRFADFPKGEDEYYKNVIRPVMKNGEWKDRLQALKDINFDNPYYKTSEEKLRTCKSLAFNIAQTICLLQGAEVYTKNEIKNHFPNLAPLIDYEQVSANELLKDLTVTLSTLLELQPIISLP